MPLCSNARRREKNYLFQILLFRNALFKNKNLFTILPSFLIACGANRTPQRFRLWTMQTVIPENCGPYFQGSPGESDPLPRKNFIPPLPKGEADKIFRKIFPRDQRAPKKQGQQFSVIAIPTYFQGQFFNPPTHSAAAQAYNLPIYYLLTSGFPLRSSSELLLGLCRHFSIRLFRWP